SEWKYNDDPKTLPEKWVYDVCTFKSTKKQKYPIWQSTFDISKETPSNVLYTTDFRELKNVNFSFDSTYLLEFMEKHTNAHISGSLLSVSNEGDQKSRIYFLDKQKYYSRVCAIEGLLRSGERDDLIRFCGPPLDPCAKPTGTFADCALCK